jgi:hypothetical protein
MKTLDEAMALLVRTPGMSDADAKARLADLQIKNEGLLDEVCGNEHAQGLADHMGYALHAELNRIAALSYKSEEEREVAMSATVRKFLITAFGNGVMIGIHMERHEEMVR